MANIRVYLKPFDSAGNYTASWTEITDYVDLSTLSSISLSLDRGEYNVGVFRYSNMRMGVNNSTGLFSEPGQANTLFAFKRDQSQIRIDWEYGPAAYYGFAEYGVDSYDSTVEIFRGLMSDESAEVGVASQRLGFSVFGLESTFEKALTPYSTISNGDLLSSVIHDCLNQAPMTDVMTVDAGNITCGTDVTIDDKTDLETKTVKEALDELLLISNSVLYIEAGVVYVKPRTANVSVDATFYGPSATAALEDVLDLSDIKSGANKTFNYWNWQDTTTVSSDTDSINTNGIKKKIVNSALITDTSKRTSILSGLLAEFKDPQRETTLKVEMNETNLALGFLSRLALDYPAVALSGDFEIPTYGLSEYAVAGYPVQQNVTTFDPDSDNFKVMSIRYNIKEFTIDFGIRGV